MPTGKKTKNLILDVQKDSCFFSLSKTASLHYMRLLSETENVDGVIYSCLLADVVPSKVSDELVSAGCIEIDDGKDVVLGEKGVLFVNNTNPFKDLYERLNTDLIHPIKNRRRVSSVLLEAAEKLSFYLEQPTQIKKQNDLMTIYGAIYALTQERPHRSFTGKEVGQFKHLIGFYGAGTAAQLIVLYVIDNPAPLIGGLLNRKDYYYNKLYKGKKESKTYEDADETSTGKFG